MPGAFVEVLRGARPRHWLKNGFVLAPALFSGHATDPQALARAALAAAAFSLAASGGYLVNDVLDREADRADPVKRRRPVAAGRLAPGAALGAAAGFVVAAMLLALALPGGVAWALAAYLALTLSYSAGLKRVPVVETMVLAAGFVVRLAAGAQAISVPASHWLLICGFLLALLLAFGKRVPSAPGRTARYPAGFLPQAVTLLAGATVMAYALYTVAPETVARVGSRGLLLTAPLVLLGVLRYLWLLHGEGAQDPTAALLRDRPLLLIVVVWAAAAAAVVHLTQSLR